MELTFLILYTKPEIVMTVMGGGGRCSAQAQGVAKEQGMKLTQVHRTGEAEHLRPPVHPDLEAGILSCLGHLCPCWSPHPLAFLWLPHHPTLRSLSLLQLHVGSFSSALDPARPHWRASLPLFPASALPPSRLAPDEFPSTPLACW